MENKHTEEYRKTDTVQSPIVGKSRPVPEEAVESKPPEKVENKAQKGKKPSESPKSTPAAPKGKTDEEGRSVKTKTKSPIFSITISVTYIVLIVLVSVVLSALVITAVNDVFAFVKEENEVTVVINEYPTVIDLSNALEEAGVINYPGLFRLYARLKLDEGDNFVPGEYKIFTNSNYDNLLTIFLAQNHERETVTVTIPEGYTVDEIIELFLSYGMGTRDGFVDAIQNGQYDFEFIRRLDEKPLPEGRKYRLEGYLFPDTYYFYKDWDEELIINKLLEGFEARFRDEYYEYIDSTDLTLDEYLIIASMIQREAYFNTDMEFISSVFHNRLDKPSTYPKLESDATVLYALGVHKTDLTEEDLNFQSPYNTYVTDGLPPSAICNPGIDAIYTALRPADSKYYYFVSRANGETLFAETYKQHQANVNEVRNER